MILSWPMEGVQPFYSALTLNDTFNFFVPPLTAPSEIIDALTYQGTWNASTNTPTLASSTGDFGDFYKVSVAGSTVLDDVSSWAVGDYLLFSGVEWLKSASVTQLERYVIDMLALEISPDFGREPTRRIEVNAMRGWGMIQAAYIKPPTAVMDGALMNVYVNGNRDTGLINTNGDNDGDVYLIDD